MENIGIILIALALDALLGEVPNRFHPVAWLGNFINLQLKYGPQAGRKRQFAFGICVVLLTVFVITTTLVLSLIFLKQWNTLTYLIISAIILKSTFALRGLWTAVEEVEVKLRSSEIAAARCSVRALVSRDTGSLDEKQVISASIESCAENLCDSFIAPLFYFAIFGLPGAVAYRIINTFDAMIGYHGKWEYTGKFAARLDDVVNFIPARLSGVVITLSALITRNQAKRAWQTMLKEHGRTESPNAGWSMAAMAGSLGVALEKDGHYSLGTVAQEIAVNDISRSQHIMLAAAGIWCMGMISIEVIKIAATQAIY